MGCFFPGASYQRQKTGKQLVVCNCGAMKAQQKFIVFFLGNSSLAHPEYFGREVRETMDEAAVLIFCRCLIVLKVLLRSALSPDHTFNIRTFF